MISLIDLTQQLYTAKIFMAVISLFNVLINMFTMYVLMSSGLWLFALLSSIVFVFNILFFAATVSHWRKKDVMKGEVL